MVNLKNMFNEWCDSEHNILVLIKRLKYPPQISYFYTSEFWFRQSNCIYGDEDEDTTKLMGHEGSNISDITSNYRIYNSQHNKQSLNQISLSLSMPI